MKVFGNPKVYAHGWYGVLPSASLRVEQREEIKIFGQVLVLYRSENGILHAIEAFCPHLGAHLQHGRVEGESIRCGFHGWKFSEKGDCEEVMGAADPLFCKKIRQMKTFLVGEKFGMIWIHSQSDSREPLPEFPPLEKKELFTWIEPFGPRKCHPHFILGQGIEEIHYQVVHRKTTEPTGPLRFDSERLSQVAIRFNNVAPIQGESLRSRWLRSSMGGVIRAQTTYYHATTALIELGTSSFPLYAIFSYRPNEHGGTQGYNIYLAPRKSGAMSWLKAITSLWLARRTLRKGAQEEAHLQDTLQLRLSDYSLVNAPFKAFVDYVNEQSAASVNMLGDEVSK